MNIRCLAFLGVVVLIASLGWACHPTSTQTHAATQPTQRLTLLDSLTPHPELGAVREQLFYGTLMPPAALESMAIEVAEVAEVAGVGGISEIPGCAIGATAQVFDAILQLYAQPYCGDGVYCLTEFLRPGTAIPFLYTPSV